MNIKYKKIIKDAAVFIVFVLLSSFFTLSLFPYNRLKRPIEATVYNRTGIKMRIGKIYYAFPFHLNVSAVSLKTIRIKNAAVNISPLVLIDYIIFKKILLNINFYNVKVLKIAGMNANFDYVKTGLTVNKLNGQLHGDITFKGDAGGKIDIKKAVLNPFIIKNAFLRLKPGKAFYKHYRLIFKTLFKGSKGGYYTYYIRNLNL